MQITVSDYKQVVELSSPSQHDDNSPVLKYVQVDPNSPWTHDSMEGESSSTSVKVNWLKT